MIVNESWCRSLYKQHNTNNNTSVSSSCCSQCKYAMVWECVHDGEPMFCYISQTFKSTGVRLVSLEERLGCYTGSKGCIRSIQLTPQQRFAVESRVYRLLDAMKDGAYDERPIDLLKVHYGHFLPRSCIGARHVSHRLHLYICSSLVAETYIGLGLLTRHYSKPTLEYEPVDFQSDRDSLSMLFPPNSTREVYFLLGKQQQHQQQQQQITLCQEDECSVLLV